MRIRKILAIVLVVAFVATPAMAWQSGAWNSFQDALQRVVVSIIPSVSNTYNLGSASKVFANVYATAVNATNWIVTSGGYVGLGATKGRIVFTDDTIDSIRVKGGNFSITNDSSTGMDANVYSASGSPSFFGWRSRGSEASPANVQSGDYLANFGGFGTYDLSGAGGGVISILVDGTPGTGDMPGRISFWTSPDGSTTLAERGRIDNAGLWTFGLDNAGGTANAAGSVKFISVGDNAFYNTFTAGTNTANATYTLPTAMPAVSGYVLTSTDAGVMSWAAAAAGIPQSEPATGNMFVGTDAGAALTTGDYNTLLGQGAGKLLTSTSNVTALGYLAGSSIVAAPTNATYVGAECGKSATNRNTAVGYQALYNGAGNAYDNVCIGETAGYTLSGGDSNTFVGTAAGYSFSGFGGVNTFVGYRAGYTQTAARNTLIGCNAAPSSTGVDNTMMGYLVGLNQSTATANVFIGNSAGEKVTTSPSNVAVGYQAGGGTAAAAGTGTGLNTCVGYQAGQKLQTGAHNILLGDNAGDAITTGSTNVIIGSNIDADSATANGQMNIGGVIKGTGLSTGLEQVNIPATFTTLKALNWGIDLQASDTYKVDLAATCTTISTGQMVMFKANTANTGACTIEVNSTGPNSLKAWHDQDPADNYIESGSVVQCVWDGAVWQILTPDSNP